MGFSTIEWVAIDVKNANRAFCKYCNQSLNAHLKALKRHASTAKHVNCVKESRDAQVSIKSLTGFVKPLLISDKQKVLELRMAAYIAKQSSFNGVADLTNLMNSAEPRICKAKIKVSEIVHFSLNVLWAPAPFLALYGRRRRKLVQLLPYFSYMGKLF